MRHRSLRSAKVPSRLLPALGAGALLVVLASCQSLDSVAPGFQIGGGGLDRDEVAAIGESAKAVKKSFEDFTPEQEYYIGRSVGATILDQYEVYEDPEATRYINLLGQSLAMASDRPELFRGYHFLILDSDEINAFATPGGHVFLTRGMLRLAESESEVAAILAHEIGHIVHKHGLKAIKASRINTALTSAAITTAKVATDNELEQLTETFEGSIKDITSTLVNSGYSRGAERDADQAAVTILSRVGYDPTALIRVLEAMGRELEPGGLDFAKTHPDPNVRIRVVERAVDDVDTAGTLSSSPASRRRYQQALSEI